MIKNISLGFVLALLFLTQISTRANETIIKDKQGMDCYIYLPDNYDKSKTYWLVVGVHGYKGNGKGAAGLSNWAKRGDCIVIGPSFRNGYQMGNGIHAKKLIALFHKLSKKYKLKRRMFLYGFSGGAQFAHRFTFKYPRYVSGCAAHSAGSWATGGAYGSISNSAKRIPFAISCGEKDTAKSMPSYKMNRLEWFKKFAALMKKKKFDVSANVIPNVGHTPSKTSKLMTFQCFEKSKGIQ